MKPYALAFFVAGRPMPVGEFDSIDEAVRAASLINQRRLAENKPLVEVVVDRRTLRIVHEL